MKFGVSIRFDSAMAALVKEAGFDYVETWASAIAEAKESELKEFKSAGIPVYAANRFINLRISDPDRDNAAIADYLSALFEHSHYLGLNTLVFGSGSKRKALEGQSVDTCRQIFTDFLGETVVPYCEKYDIRIAIEPLRDGEDNIVNTVPQAVAVAKAVNSPYIRALADVYHMLQTGDSLDDLPQYKGWVIHGHTSNPCFTNGKKRVFPKAGDTFRQEAFLKPLAEAGVETCSVEADLLNERDDITEAFAILKPFKTL